MANTQRPLISLILVLISAVSCAAAWLLTGTNFIPAIDTAVALLSVGVLVWGLHRVYRQEAAQRQVKWALVRVGRNLIHSLWAIVGILLNVVVCLIWYFSLPDYQTSYNGHRYYAYQLGANQPNEAQVEVTMRSGLREEHVSVVFVGQPCHTSACFGQAIIQAGQHRINKKP